MIPEMLNMLMISCKDMSFLDAHFVSNIPKEIAEIVRVATSSLKKALIVLFVVKEIIGLRIALMEHIKG